MWWLQTPTPSPISNGGNGWFFQQDPPPEWVWIAIILALVALVLTVPPLIAMIYGHHKLVGEYVSSAGNPNSWLAVKFRNDAINSKWLRRFVDRNDVDVSVHCRVYKEGTSIEVANWIPWLSDFNNVRARTMTLRASKFSEASVVIAVHSPTGAFVMDDDQATKMTALPADSYVLHMSIVEGGDFDSKGKRFVVAADRIYWA